MKELTYEYCFFMDKCACSKSILIGGVTVAYSKCIPSIKKKDRPNMGSLLDQVTKPGL